MYLDEKKKLFTIAILSELMKYRTRVTEQI